MAKKFISKGLLCNKVIDRKGYFLENNNVLECRFVKKGLLSNKEIDQKVKCSIGSVYFHQ